MPVHFFDRVHNAFPVQFELEEVIHAVLKKRAERAPRADHDEDAREFRDGLVRFFAPREQERAEDDVERFPRLASFHVREDEGGEDDDGGEKQPDDLPIAQVVPTKAFFALADFGQVRHETGWGHKAVCAQRVFSRFSAIKTAFLR